MRIAYISFLNVDVPSEAVSSTIANAYRLSEAGADVTLMVQKKKEEFKEKSFYEDFRLEQRSNFHLSIYPEKSYFGMNPQKLFFFNAFGDIKKLHKASSLDAVISPDPEALPELAGLKKKKGIDVFYQPHDFYLDLSLRRDHSSDNAQKYHQLEEEFLPQMAGILCVQETQAELYRKYLPGQKVLVAKPGLRRVGTHADSGYYRRLIGYMGSFRLNEGVGALLNAFKALQEYGFKLILIGGKNQQEMAEVKQRVFELGLEGKVLMMGQVSYEQVSYEQIEAYLEKISVGIVPLTDTFYNRYLAAPSKLFDYISRAIPVVASDLPSLRNFIEEGKEGVFFKPDDPKALAQGIAKIFANEETYENFRKSVGETANHYLWSERGKAMIDAIKSAKA